MKRKATVLRPVLGFGVAGWCGVIVLVGLATIAAWPGLDERYAIQKWLAETFGVTYWFTHVLTWLSFSVCSARFTVTTLVLLVPAFFLAAKRFPWIVLSLLSVATIVPLVVPGAMRLNMGGVLPPFIGEPLYPGGVSITQMIVEVAVISLLLSMLLVVVTRSKLVALGVGLAFVAALMSLPLARIWSTRIGAVHVGADGVLWTLLTVVPVYVWAIRSRRAPADGLCRACGYDLAGVTGRVCPECGEPVPSNQSSLTA